MAGMSSGVREAMTPSCGPDRLHTRPCRRGTQERNHPSMPRSYRSNRSDGFNSGDALRISAPAFVTVSAPEGCLVGH